MPALVFASKLRGLRDAVFRKPGSLGDFPENCLGLDHEPDESKKNQMSYADLTTKDRNPIKRWLQRQRFSDAIHAVGNASPTKALRVLDYGAGNGELIRQLVRVGAIQSWVYEPTPSLMAEAKENLTGIDSVTFIDEIDSLESSSFDFIFCMEVFEHLPERELFAAMENIHRMLKPDGSVIIGVPHELFFPALIKGAFRTIRRYGEFDTVPRNVIAATLGRPPAIRPASEIAAGYLYHFHHLGFDYRALERKLRGRFVVAKKWFSPFPVLGSILNSEVYFRLQKAQ